MKKRHPWNRIDEQVYSIVSLSKENIPNMNIATYVTPITMKPKRYVIAVYRGTQTHSNIFENKKQKYVLLQAFSKEQASLVKILGKKSARIYNKESFIKKQALDVVAVEGKEFPYLKQSAFVLQCRVETYSIVDDHDLITVLVEKVIKNNHDAELLTTEDLTDQKIIL